MHGDRDPLPPVALGPRREKTIELLCRHFAADHLEADELERLIDAAHAATTPDALDRLLEGLPQLTGPEPRPGSVAVAAPGTASDQQVVIAVMGGADRKGAWTPARKVFVLALMGGVDLDFREARLEPGVTEVFVLALMGGVEITVPPGLRVDSSGIGVMGGFEHRSDRHAEGERDAPLLRIVGGAMMGGVEISERLPGESQREARRRRGAERRLQRGEPRDGSGWAGS